MNYPCSTCTRVKDAANCENKNCQTWRTWFLEKWSEMRNRVFGARAANAWDADLFVSIHFNSSGGDGYEKYFLEGRK